MPRGEKETITKNDAGMMPAALTSAEDIVAAGPIQVQHKYDLAELNDLGGSSFLPRLQLMGSNSDAVKDGKVERGWALIHGKEQYEFFGKEVSIWVITYRKKAMDVSDRANPIAIFDRNDPEFQRIFDERDTQNSGCMAGNEFLVYVPAAKQGSKWATLFMAGKSARIEAQKFGPILEQGNKATLQWKVASNARYKWDAPVILRCTAPLEQIPEDELQEELDKFNNPPAKVIERAPEDSRER